MPESLSRFSPPVVTAEPSGVSDGDIWYRSDEYRFIHRTNGVSSDINPTILYPDPVSGAWYDPYGVSGTSTTEIAWALNGVLCMPISVNKKVTLAGIAINVVTAGTSSNVARFALYSGDLPTTLITDYGTVSTTTNGVKTWSPSTVISPGVLYWLAYVNQVGTAHTVNTLEIMNHNLNYHVASGTPSTTNFTTNVANYLTWTASGAFATTPTVTVGYHSNSTRKPRTMIKFS